MPFGGGPRACVGQSKALAEATYVLVRLVQKFPAVEARPQAGKDGWEGEIKLTVRNANGCRVGFFGRGSGRGGGGGG